MHVCTHFFRPTLKEAVKNAGGQPLHKVIIYCLIFYVDINFYCLIFYVNAIPGLEIVTHWSPMRLKIEQWTISPQQPVFQNTKCFQVKSLYLEALLTDHLS